MLPSQVIFKVVSRCNIACTYCYQDELEGGAWRGRFPRMSPAALESCLDGYLEHARSPGARMQLNLQGGEPLLVPRSDFRGYLEGIRRQEARHRVSIDIAIQTNALLLDDAWCQLFREHDVLVGVSLDGPPEVHDRRRVDKKGRGTGVQVSEKIRLAIASGARVGGICVADAAASGAAVYAYFCALGLPAAHILLPAQNHATGLAQRDRRPYAPFLIELFDAWAAAGDEGTQIRDFEEVIAGVLGLRASPWILNNRPSSWICFLPDGSIETGDPYGICQADTTRRASLAESLAVAMQSESFLAHASPPPSEDPRCRSCAFAHACGGGFPTFRYSRQNGFRNRTVYCEDTFRFYSHVAERLRAAEGDGVPDEEPVDIGFGI